MLTLEKLTADFARAMKSADAKRPVAVNRRSKKPFQPGIGPHSETDTLELVGAELKAADPARYDGSWTTGVPYPGLSRQKCDVCLGRGPGWDWAIEVKMLRFLGDNGRVNDNILMHILSPYPADRSALTDCEKLLDSELAGQKAVMIYGYDHDDWSLDPAIEAFETLARTRVQVGERCQASFEGLIHPVHERGRVFAWVIRR